MQFKNKTLKTIILVLLLTQKANSKMYIPQIPEPDTTNKVYKNRRDKNNTTTQHGPIVKTYEYGLEPVWEDSTSTGYQSQNIGKRHKTDPNKPLPTRQSYNMESGERSSKGNAANIGAPYETSKKQLTKPAIVKSDSGVATNNTTLGEYERSASMRSMKITSGSKPKKEKVRFVKYKIVKENPIILPEQQIAFDMRMPKPDTGTRVNWANQILPPNISQTQYTKSNRHLTPAVFESDYQKLFLHYAKDRSEINSFKVMLTKVHQLNCKDSSGNTALNLATANKNYKAAYILVNYGADINATNIFDTSPIHIASYNNDNRMIMMMMQYGAKLNVIDGNNMTPLMYAIYNKNPEMIRAMLDFGANPQFSNSLGINAIKYAIQLGDESTALLLSANI